MSSSQHLMIGLPGSNLSAEEISLLQQWQVGGYILFSRNIESPEQTRRLTDELRKLSKETPIIAIDQEGGRVSRTKGIGNVLPSAAQLAERGTPDLIARHGLLTAEALDLLGINLNLAPVLDVAHHPETQNALPERCWGRDSQQVISNAGLFNRYHRKLRIATCGKHFPGSGKAQVDPHFELPKIDATLKDLLVEDLLPFTALMPELDAVMSGHVRFPALDPKFPASLSEKITTQVLRNQLGYDGLALTDDLDMGAIRDHYGLREAVEQALLAGHDLALVCHSFDQVNELLGSLRELPPYLKADSERRLERFRKKLRHPPSFSSQHWNDLNKRIFELRVETLGEEEASAPLADGTSPVTTY